MNASNPGVSPLKLERLQRELTARIEAAAREHEAQADGPLDLDMNFGSETGASIGDAALRRSVEQLVRDFHEHPAVVQAGVRVHKVTALDSDADGEVAVKVQYDYRE